MQYNVLIIDDDQDLLFLADRFLKAHDKDFFLVPTKSAQEALQKLDEEEIDAVICDFYMGPGEMNGLELLEWMRNNGNNTPFIIFTGHSREEIAIKALNLGADYYLEKGDDLEDLFIEIAIHIKTIVKNRKTEQALHESEQRYRTLVHSINDLIFVMDQSDNFSQFHAGPEDELYATPEEFLGKHITDVLPSYITDTYLELSDEVRTSGKRRSFDYELEIQGEMKAYSANLDLHEDKQSIVWTVTNITKRRIAEIALKKSEMKYRLLYENLSDGLMVTDVKGNITMCSQRSAEIFDSTPEEIINTHISTLIHPDDLDRILDIFHQGLETMNPSLMGVEVRGIRKDGLDFYYHVTSKILTMNGMPVGYQSLIRDITEKKLAELALEESEEKYRVLIENMQDGIVIIQDWKISFANEVFSRIIGYPLEEIIGTHFLEFIAPEYQDFIEKEYQQRSIGEQIPVDYEVNLLHKAGKQIIIQARVVNFMFQDIMSTLVNVVDITDKIKAEETIRETEEIFSLFADYLPGALFIKDQDSQYVFVNKFVERVFGETEFIERTPDEVYDNKNIAAKHRLEDIKVLQGEIIDVEEILQDKSGIEYIHRTIKFPIQREDGSVLIGGLSFDVTYFKEIEKALRESEEIFSSFADHLPGTIFIKDEHSRLLYANKFMKEKLGAEDWIGKRTEESLPPDIAKSMIEDDKKALKDGIVEVIETVPSIHGIESIYRTIKFAIPLDGRPPLLGGFAIDISEQMKAEQSLRESESRFRYFFENEPNYCYMISPDGTILNINSAALKILGYEKEEVIGKTLELVYAPESLIKMKELFSKWETTGKLANEEMVIITRNGERRIVMLSANVIRDNDGNIIHSISVQTDITELKEVERALKKSEEELWESREKYRQLIDNVMDVIIEFDAKGRITFVSPQVSYLLGYDPEEVFGKTGFEFVHPDDLKSAREKILKALGGEHVFGFEFRARHKEGRYIDLIASGKIVMEESTQRSILSIRDITELKKATSAVSEERDRAQKSEQKLRSIIEYSPDGIVLTDENGMITEWNLGIQQLSGLNKETVLNTPVWEVLFKIVPPENRTEEYRVLLKENILSVLQNGSAPWIGKITSRTTYRIDGTIRYTLDLPFTIPTDKGVLLGSILRDVTDLKEKEDEIKRQRDFLEKVIDSLTHPFYVIDANDYTIKMANRAARQGDLSSTSTCFALTHKSSEPCSGEIHPCPLREVKETKKPVIVEHIHHRIGEKTRYVEVNGYPIFDDEGNVVQMIEYNLDMTEQREANSLLKRQKDELSDLAHIMSHDLGNNLRNIRSYLELCEREYDKAIVDRIARLVDRTEEILESSAALAEAGLVIEKKENVNLHNTIQDVIETILPSNITFILDEMPTVVGDQDKIGQIFQNLLLNAIEHGKPKQIEVRKEESSAGLSILIINDGIPIPDEIREKIFVRGFSTKEDGKGLGLAIVKKLIEAHGWQIELDESTKTMFRILVNR